MTKLLDPNGKPIEVTIKEKEDVGVKATPIVVPELDVSLVTIMSCPFWLPTPEDVAEAKTGDRCSARRGSDGMWALYFSVIGANMKRVCFAVAFNPGGRHVVDNLGNISKWGVIKLGPTVWALTPTVSMHHVYNGFIVLRKVPDPAPWEMTMAVPTGSTA